MELPSGISADVYLGRKMTLMFATLSRFVAFAMISFDPIQSRPFTLIISAILSGTANAMVSGTKDALLYESLEKLNREKEFNSYVSTSSLMWPIGSTLSGIIGSAIISNTQNIQDTFVVSLIPLIFAVISAYFVSEPVNLQSKNKHEELTNNKPKQCSILYTSIEIMTSRELGLLAMFTVGNFVFYETTLQYRGIFLEYNGVEKNKIGIWDSVRFFMSSLGTLLAPRFVVSLSRRFVILACVCTSSISVILFASFENNKGLYLLFAALAWGVQWPLEKSLVNDMVPSGSRATAISVISLLKKAGAAIAVTYTSTSVLDLENTNSAFVVLASVALGNVIPLVLMR